MTSQPFIPREDKDMDNTKPSKKPVQQHVDLSKIDLVALAAANIQVKITLVDGYVYFGQFLGDTLKRDIGVPCNQHDESDEYYKFKHRDQLIYILKTKVKHMEFSL